MIDAPAPKVWLALTTPELIKEWFFGVDTETDWTEGSSIVHRGLYQGQPYEDKGRIVKIQPDASSSTRTGARFLVSPTNRRTIKRSRGHSTTMAGRPSS